MLKVCATDPSEYYLEFLDHLTSDLYLVFIRLFTINENHYVKRSEKVPVKWF